MGAERITRRLHSSWLLAWLAIGILLGVLLAAVVAPLDWPTSLVYPLVLIAVGLVLYWRLTGLFIIMLLAGLLLGLVRGSHLQTSLASYQAYLGQTVEVAGVVNEDVTLSRSGSQQIRLRQVAVDGQNLPGIIWVTLSTELELQRSDKIVVSGVLQEGFGNLPASMNRATLLEASRVKHGDLALELRDSFANNGVRRAIDEPEASLGVGYLVGQRSTLPPRLDDNLRLLGLTHVVVASGYNLTILVRFARRSFAKKSKYLAAAAALLMIVAFVLVTGFSPSMSRAALVAGLSLLAWYVGRTINPLILLLITAATTALINPSFVWGDLGWYLSFLSFAGIMLLAPLIRHYFWGVAKKLPGFLQIVIETGSAQLATLPLIAYVFGQYSPLALPANLLVLPFIPLAMLLSFVAGVVGLLITPIAYILGFPAYAVLSYMTYVVDGLASLPIAKSELSVGLPFLVGGYCLLVLVGLYLYRVTRHNFNKESIIE